MFKCAWTVQDYDGHTSYWCDFWFKGYSCTLFCQRLYRLSNELLLGANRFEMIKVCMVKIWMKCVQRFGTGRYKRQADITLLFQYIYMTAILLNCISWLCICLAGSCMCVCVCVNVCVCVCERWLLYLIVPAVVWLSTIMCLFLGLHEMVCDCSLFQLF